MTNRLELNWKLDGFVDEQRYYCSETHINPENLPEPVSILAGNIRTHIDNTERDVGKTYHVRVSAIKNGIEKISDEKSILFGEAWTPQSLANPAKLWLSSESVVKDSSDRISQANDLSSSGGNATQLTNSLKPVLLDNKVHFDGADDYMNLATLNLFQNIGCGWVFAVVSKNTLDTSDIERPVIAYSNNSNSFRFGLTMGNTSSGNRNKITLGGRRLDSDSYDGVDSSFQVVSNRDYIVCGIIDYANRKIDLYIDGLLNVSKTNAFTGSGNTSNTASTRARLAGGTGAVTITAGDVSLSSIILNNQTLSTEDRQKLEGWAAHKYGLTANLPSDHPYKTLVPTL